MEFTADFYMLKPVDQARGNGRLFYEVGNRGGKSMLRTFQKARNSVDPETEADFGDGALMNQGYTLLWMGWQWDVPDGQMRTDMPIASDHGNQSRAWFAETLFRTTTSKRSRWRIAIIAPTRSTTPTVPTIS